MALSVFLPSVAALLGILIGAYLTGRRDRVNAIIELNLADYRETKQICRDAFGLLLRLQREATALVKEGRAFEADTWKVLSEFQPRIEFHLPPEMHLKFRAAVETIAPVTKAMLNGDREEALKSLEDGSIKAARVEFMESVQAEFDRLYRYVYKLGASPLTVAWRTLLNRWPK